MVKKEKVNYSCSCGMLFGNRKDNYLRHINKKNPCSALSNKAPEKAPKNSSKAPETKQSEVETKQNEIKTNDIFCPYCLTKFFKKYGLNRHLDGRCKNKPVLSINKTEQENNKLIEIDNKLNEILKQNEELKNENKKLKKQIKKTNKKPKTIINNLIINQNNILVNHNDMDLTKIDKKLFIQPLLHGIGKQKILKTIENVYINEDYPEHHNIVITDKNRGYLKIYDNGEWKTYDFNLINTLIDKVLNQSKTYIFELKENYIIKNINKICINDTHPYYNKLNVKPKSLFSKYAVPIVNKLPFEIYNDGDWKTNDKELINIVINEILTQTINYTIEFKQQYNKGMVDTLKTSEKYINFCDADFLEELKEQQNNDEKDNADLIKRCIEFRNMVCKDTINLLHDNKNKLIKTNPSKNKIIELN
jgi:predicted HNH restriction endonuclease